LDYEKSMLDTFSLNKDKAEKIFNVTIDLDDKLGNISITPNKKEDKDNVVDLMAYKKDKDDDGTRH